MPVEIKEMNVKVNVQDTKKKKAQQNQTNTGSLDFKEEIIAECIERIMEMLNQQKEP